MAEQIFNKKIFFIHRNSKYNHFELLSKFSNDYYSRISSVNKDSTEKNGNPVLIIFNCFVQSMRAGYFNDKQKNSIVYERDNPFIMDRNGIAYVDSKGNVYNKKVEETKQNNNNIIVRLFKKNNKNPVVYSDRVPVEVMQNYCEIVKSVLNVLFQLDVLPKPYISKKVLILLRLM